MIVRKAERKQAKIKLALQGPAGSGKTFSAILMAYGLVGVYSDICVIDTENGSADLYAHIGEYKVIPLTKPYTPERYIQAIELAEKEGVSCIIIDGLSQCWEYLLDYHAGLAGNSFTNWSKITPRINDLITKILSSTSHIIVTIRVKQDYILQDKGNGKLSPEKVGLKTIMRDGIDYEFTIVLELDINHLAKSSKDRTGLFADVPPFKITTSTGCKILEWCLSGASKDKVKSLIENATNLQQLTEIYKSYTAYYPVLEAEFIAKKTLLTTSILSPNNNLQNGITNH
ncbi:MAG TPA: AAA family ATPase [Saprospiraceae bacterium]|jgi:hypothetical protein|nr:AAA family ATPase [Saprospiraceae bacterium]HMT71443.1 AAA family ATPase [Saprospiraceae bacterium]